MQLATVLVLLLIVNLPIVTALEISNIQVQDITDDSAVVTWETDEPADSFVRFGEDPQNLMSRGDASRVTDHSVALDNLQPLTTYQFEVESNKVVDNVEGAYHSFQTLAVDITAPGLTISAPEAVQGSRVTINGTSEKGAELQLFVNGIFAAKQQVESQSSAELVPFVFTDVLLVDNTLNEIKVDSKDRSGNTNTASVSVSADAKRPVFELTPLPAIIGELSVKLQGKISEEVSYEVFVNNGSVVQKDGLEVDETLNLQEGNNTVRITAVDKAGWDAEETFNVLADSRVPSIRAELAKGYEYYEGRAESDITGETEAGATVYLYIYRPLSYEFKPDFSKAVAKTTADVNGSFSFNDVKFSQSVFDASLGDLKPREVPSDLLQATIYPIEQIAADQENTYFVYLIAEDQTGKTAYWQQTVNVNRCLSTNFAFGVETLTQFTGPLKLNPILMDEGRQEVQATFKLNYLGKGLPEVGPSGDEISKGFRLQGTPRIEPACTQSMRDDDKFGVGCTIFPRSTRNIVKSPDDSAIFGLWQLGSTQDMSKREDDFWNDFEKRQIVFPLKVQIEYQERTGKDAQGNDQWSETKVQTSCQDLSYFVDVPLKSNELLPDFIADEGIDALDFTVKQIQNAREYVETAYIITGISCISSFLLRFVTRGVRIATSRLEAYFSAVKTKLTPAQMEEQGACPVPGKGQETLYLQSTVENWYRMLSADQAKYEASIPAKVVETFLADGGSIGDATKKILLDERCPRTAGAWKLEAALDTAYKWTCDRAFCRAVPAGWTATKTEEEISKVILEGQQCAVTGRGIPLQKVEGCKELLRQDATPLDPTLKIDDVGGVCWRRGDGSDQLYYYDERNQDSALAAKGIYRLTPVRRALSNVGDLSEPLVVTQPDGSDYYVAGQDKSCQQVCDDRRKPGFEEDNLLSYAKLGAQGQDPGLVNHNSNVGIGCYKEELVDGVTQLFDKDGDQLGTKDDKERYAAGYTNDCFINQESAGETFYTQCVCMGKQPNKQTYSNTDRTLRTAEPRDEENNVEEEWSYRQDRIFKETSGPNRKGTYYPDIRYYSGRDLSGAFGANYIFDYFRDQEKVAKVDPHAGFIETAQTLCTSGILKNLVMLESMLTGLRNCLEEAKTTEFHDAGMCKAWFSQQVCGLVYKGVASLLTSCTPSNFDDVGKDSIFGDVGAFVSEGTRAMSSSLQSSITDLKEDYGNAQLNQYFSGGAQGFAQSLCMAAFGFDFPLFSDEFLLDAAYAFPTQSSVLVGPAYRELSTFNPAKQTATFNYEVGAAITPGCRIRRWDVSLKCVGPEDRGLSGVDPTCNGVGCDCLNAQPTSQFAGERVMSLKQGHNLPSGRLFSVPIESPQRVDSHFRYDHVKVELELDPAEDPEFCIDPEVRQGNKAVYYYPITDTTPAGFVQCEVNAATGQYSCPEFAKLFGFGGAYLQEPYMTCFDKKTSNYVDCQTPNLFLDGDIIQVRVSLNTDGKPYCLKRTVTNVAGIPDNVIYQVPEQLNGPLNIEQSLGTVQASMFRGGANVLEKVAAADRSNRLGCNIAYPGSPATVDATKEYEFKYKFVTADALELSIPPGVSVLGTYTDKGGLLALSERTQLTLDEINRAQFDVQGFVASNVLGGINPAEQPGQCTYRIRAQSAFSQSDNVRNIAVEYELLDVDEGGSCLLPKNQVKATQGKARHPGQIRIQLQETAVAQAGGLHEFFMAQNYDHVHALALDIMNRHEGDFTNAVAIYYDVASWIMKGNREKDPKKYSNGVQNGLNYFFQRKFGGVDAPVYGPDVTSKPEYDKIKNYLCEVDKVFGGVNQGKC